MPFVYHIHRTAGLVNNVNSIPTNLPDAGFYSMQAAGKFLRDNQDPLNYSHIVNAESGDVCRTLPPGGAK